MKTALITGSEGFVGQHLWKELENSGYEVSGTILNIPETGIPQNVYQCNIVKREEIDNLISRLKPEYIFHLAALSQPGISFSKPALTFEINVIGTINLLESIRATEGYKPRIVLIGSAGEYGPVTLQMLPVTEETTLNPSDPYAISKVTCWFLAKQYVKAYGFDIVYSVSFNHTGPGQGLGLISSDVASQIVEIEKGKKEPVILTGDLSAERDTTDVRDVVRAYRMLAEKGKAGERYIVSSGKSSPVKNIADTLVGLAKVEIKQVIDPNKNRPSDIKMLFGSHSKLTDLTGWNPEIPIEKTLSDLLDWYRSQP